MQASSRTSSYSNINSRMACAPQALYTHQLPYGVRQQICNLIDADQSWRLLGGQFMHLDATQLRLVGQALLRNDSPTGELLNKLDSANTRVSELYGYLANMGHCRATELLKPYVINGETRTGNENERSGRRPSDAPTGTLDTPTPSFSSIQPMAIMNSSEFNMIAPADYQNQNPDEWRFVETATSNKDLRAQIDSMPPRRCHNENATAPRLIELGGQQQQQRQRQQQQQGASNGDEQQDKSGERADPGDEIVRLACANNRKRISISDQEVVNQLRLIMQITYNELKQASNDFSDSNILGNGGFASVYRGYWKGTDVAIKRLRCNLMDQALNELTILNSYRIDNILPIYGISIDGPEACLVYQFMANGSLEDRLSCKNQTAPLTWHQRAQIAEGVAKGLYYLHTLRDKPLVHGDAKSANVLLDSQFVPKLGDFGLARQVFRGRNPQTEHCTHCTVSSIHGTSVYLPPEYLRHKILSPAVDVYSYGIVLLELATGKRAYDGKRLLIDFVEDELRAFNDRQQHLNANNHSTNLESLQALRDHRMADCNPSDLKVCYELLLRLGVNCAHRIKKKRPDMGQVLNHFAQFRLSASTVGVNHQMVQVDTSLLMSGLSATTPGAPSQATTRTLTPEVTNLATTTPYGNHESNFLANNSHKRTGQQIGAASHNNNISSNLMSVEEEHELVFQQELMGTFNNGVQVVAPPHQQEAQEANGTGAHPEQQVEAMIPLLTELGFSPQLENADCEQQIN